MKIKVSTVSRFFSLLIRITQNKTEQYEEMERNTLDKRQKQQKMFYSYSLVAV